MVRMNRWWRVVPVFAAIGLMSGCPAPVESTDPSVDPVVEEIVNDPAIDETVDLPVDGAPIEPSLEAPPTDSAAEDGVERTEVMASATTAMVVRGTVRCSNSQPAVGVWIQAAEGGGWWPATSWQYPGAGGYRYFEQTITSSSSTRTVALHVGCGGTSKTWAKNLHSTNYTVSASGRVLNVACTSTAATNSVACKSAPKGPTTTGNLGDAGYCTAGAYTKWKEATGYWPNIGGNANQMDNRAAANGFSVWNTPHVRAMVVFNTPDSRYGHVGWVTKVYKDSTGKVRFDYWDMNGGKLLPNTDSKTTDFNKFVKRLNKAWDPAIQAFILAPN